MSMPMRLRPLTWSFVALFALLPFQNCGQQMSAVKGTSSSSSSQCRAQLKAEALADLGRSGLVFNCADFNSYQCERRVFAPDVEEMTHVLKECLASGLTCVDVEIRQFSTAAALARGEDPSLFVPGEAYNREEVRCGHRYAYKGIPVFEAEAEDLETALARAVSACESGVRGL